MTYVLSNQDTVLAQITQLESSITQTEVNNVTRVQEDGRIRILNRVAAHR